MIPANKRKYQSWGDFLKKRREAKYRSAREFCSKESVGISYPQYSRYEAGDQLPNLEQALELCKRLAVPVLEGLLEWNRAQIRHVADLGEVDRLLDRIRLAAPTDSSPAQGQPSLAPGLGVFTHGAISLDDIIVFNRSHLKLFSSDPGYRDIFTYINSYAPEWISAEEMAEAMSVSLAKIEDMIEKLSDLGVILVAGNRCRASKSNFYFPDDPDFFELRNLNLSHNAQSILRKLSHEELTTRRAYRGLVTRELSPKQVEGIIVRLEELLSDTVGLPETQNPENIYSFCLLLGERFSRPAAQAGLRRELPKRKSARAAEELDFSPPGLHL